MFASRTARLLASSSKHCNKWNKKQQRHIASAPTTVNPKYDTDHFIIRRDDIHIPDVPLPEAVWMDMDKWADKPALVS